jgi:hypothetical protein
MMLERLIEEGERDPAKLTRNLDEDSKGFIETLLDKLEEAENQTKQ